MSYAALAGYDVIGGKISMPLVGRWHARLSIDTDIAPQGAVRLALAEGQLSFPCTIARGYAAHGRAELLVVGGANGLDIELAPKAYRFVPARVVLADILSEAGEALADTSDAEALSTELPHWARIAGTAADTLSDLMRELSATWRILPLSGEVWAGKEAWHETDAQIDVLDEMPDEAVMVVSSELPTMYPGETLLGRKISCVEHRISADGIRSTLWIENG